MALLDTFAILFETDAGDASKEVSEFSDNLDETEKSANKTTKSIDSTNASTKSSASAFARAGTSIASLIAGYISLRAVTNSIFNTAGLSDSVGKFSRAVGLNVEEVGAWGEAIIRSGGSAESFKGILGSLTSELASIPIGGGQALVESLAMIGISALDAKGDVKNVFDLLLEISSVFQTLSAQESLAFGNLLGLDQSTILLLKEGRAEIEALLSSAKVRGVITEEDVQLSERFNDSLADLSQTWASVNREVSASSFPLLTSAVEGLSASIEANKSGIVNFLVEIVKLSTEAAQGFAIILGGAATVAGGSNQEKLGVLKNSLIGISLVQEQITEKIIRGALLLSSGLLTGRDKRAGKIGDASSIGNQNAINDTLNSANANAGAFNSARYSSFLSNRSVNNNFTFGDTRVDARGLERTEAIQFTSDALQNQIEQASGRFNDGVDN